MENQPKQNEKFNLLNDANLLIEKYKIKFSSGQYWYIDNGKWVSNINKPLTVIITREFGEKYNASFAKLEQVEKFIKNIVQDKYNIDIKKSFSVFFLNGIVTYDKNCYYDPENINQYKAACFHKYETEEEKSTFTPAIINDEFIGIIGSKELEEKMNTPEGLEIKRVVDKYFDFLSFDSENVVRKEVKKYLLATGWLAHSTATLEQILYLVSAGGSGKSWFTNKVLYELVGKQNFASFKIDRLNDSFGWQGLVNKTYAVDGECSTKLLAEDTFKQLCGTDIINVNLKNKDPINTELFCTPILCTNHLPKYTDATNSMSRRIVLVKLYSCVYEDIAAVKKKKSKWALTDKEERIFFSKLSKQYIRSLMFDAFCELYDPETKLLTPPVDSADLNKSLEIENNELYSWIEEENWITKALENAESGELFVYPTYIYDKYKDYYKSNNDDSDKGFQWKKAGLWQKFKELMESKYKNKYLFNVNKKIRQRIGGSQPSGFMIKMKNMRLANAKPEDLENMINDNKLKIKEFMTKIDDLNEEIKKFEELKLKATSSQSSSSVSTSPEIQQKKEGE